MKKSFLFSAAHLPSNLGQAFSQTLDREADDFMNAGLNKPGVNWRLFDGELSDLDKRVLESQRRYYNASHLKRDEEHLLRWAERRILRHADQVARGRIADCLGIVELEETVAALIELNSYDPEFITDLVEGRLGSAISRIPNEGYAGWTQGEALKIVEAVARLWIANDLQLEAAAAHVRIFRPTGLPLLDKSGGQPPRQGGVGRIIEKDLELFEEAARLYYGEPLQESSNFFTPTTDRSAVIRMGGAALSLTWPSSKFRHFGREVTEAEAKPFRDPMLEQTAQAMLSIWRAEHGDELEDFIRRRMDQARTELRELRTELDAIHRCRSRQGQRVCNLHGVYPLVRLWLACERAVAWTGAIGPSRSKDAEEASDFLERAVRLAKRGAAVAPPRIRKHNVADARQLFFVLRCLIVKDPQHLPSSLLRVTLPSGKTVQAGTREHAEQLRGAPFTFADIWRHQVERMGPRNSREIFSHPFTAPANRFRREHRARPTAESRAVLAHAWGTIAWRLRD